ncbi:MAG: hypothetical protein IJV83_04590 [Clostridia bacterium]|nr:hypothetical protein [Clostridia bacterium]
MEIYVIYELIVNLVLGIGKVEPSDTNYGQTLLISLVVACGLVLSLFILQGFGLYRMAKRRNMDKKFLAFIPFANILLMGRLAGECSFFGQKMKRAGLYTMVAQIIITTIALFYVVAELHLIHSGCIEFEKSAGEILSAGEMFSYTPIWVGGTSFEYFLCQYYDIADMLIMIFQLVFEVLMLVLIMGLCRRYNPRSYMWMSLLTLFIPMSRFVLVFVLRNRAPIDYEAYVRARREAYMRQQQQYQNMYGGSPYNPYRPTGNAPYGQPYGQSQPPKEEPFGEFSSKKNDEPFGEFSSKDDEPFDEFDGQNGNDNSSGSDEFFN